MIEAYAIGVNISLRGNVGTELAAVARQFENLSRIIAQTKGAINELGSGMGALARQSRTAAEGWRNAASQMRVAARAAKEAADQMARVSTPPPQPATSAGSFGGVAQPAASPSNMLRIGPATMPLLLPPPRTDFTMWNDPALPVGGGSRPVYGPPVAPPGNSGGPGAGSLYPYTSGPQAGGPNSPYTAGPLVAGGGAGGGRNGPIPLNFGPATPQSPHINQADAFVGAQGFGAMGDMLVHFVTNGIKAAGELSHEQSLLRRAGTSADVINEATRRAWETFHTVSGTQVAANLRLFGELRSQVSSDKQALEILPEIARMGLLMQNETGQKPDHLAQTVMRALEQRGQIFGADHHTMDLDKVRAELGMMYQAMTVSHGLLTPASFLNFMQQAGPAGMAMTPDAFYRIMPTAMQTMGAFRGGTAIASLFSQFVGGVMTQRTAEELTKLGLMDASKVHVKRGGHVTIDPGAIPGFDMHNPFAFFAGEDSPFQKAVRAHKGNSAEALEGVLDPAMTQELYRALGRETTRRLVAEFVALAPTFERDHKLRMGAMDPTSAEREAQNDPNMRATQFGAAVNGLMVAMGGPALDSAMDAIKSITAALTKLGEFAQDHPDAAKNIMEYGFKLGLLSLGIGVFGSALAVIPSMVRLTGMAWGIFTFGTALAGLPMSTLATLPGAMQAFGAAAIALRASLLVGAGVGLIQTAKNALFPGLDMHKWMLEHVPGAQWLNKGMNAITGGHVGSSAADIEKMGVKPSGSSAPRSEAIIPGQAAPGFNPVSYRPPPVNMEQKLEIHVQGQVDGRTLMAFVSERMLRSGTGPSGGTTGFDARTVHAGSMAA